MASLTAPMRGKAAQSAALADLFCTGAEGIRLKRGTCGPAKRPALEATLKAYCDASLLWTINNGDCPIGLVIYKDITIEPLNKIHEIKWVVVDPRFREKGIGPQLVPHIQSFTFVVELHAEARNEHSEHMLNKCGFNRTGRRRQNPRMIWRRI